jgi:peptidoglycan hydrolase-like protein with peptidoglycan-binding domain
MCAGRNPCSTGLQERASARGFERAALASAWAMIVLVLFADPFSAGLAPSAAAASSYELLPDWAREWVDQVCPRSFGPSLWTGCVERNAEAIVRPGFPDLSGFSHDEKRWLDMACPRSFGPDLWRGCMERNMAALRHPGFPDLSLLPARDRQWVLESCPYSFGPQLWRSCVERNAQALLPAAPIQHREAPRKHEQPTFNPPKKGGVVDTAPVELSVEELRELQRCLANAGFDPGPIDGVYGSATRRAIQHFERSRKRQVTGQATARLLAELRAFGPSLERRKTPKIKRAEATLTLPLPALVLTSRPLTRGGAALEPDKLYLQAADAVWSIVAGADIAAFEQMTDLLQGSAVAVTSNRLLTNCHLFAGRKVVLIVQGETSDTAKLIAADSNSDRCVLEPETLRLRPIGGMRSYSDLRVGERVFTIGSPSGLERSLGEGLISGLRSQNDIAYVQTTAPISPGSSGGGLFDGRGNLIGITTFLIQGGQQLNFAIAAESFWRDR